MHERQTDKEGGRKRGIVGGRAREREREGESARELDYGLRSSSRVPEEVI